ncbi:MAG: hypothetical protein JW953_11960 [Anaerolineae bacterium]|nr:hypothetical protein [Anaerolineae bacterium]
MTTVTEYYDIHGLVSIGVQRSAAFDPIKEISQPFRYFQVTNLDRKPDIVLEIGDFEPDKQGCYLVDHQFFVRENYFYCKDAYRTAHWQVEIKGFEYGKTCIRISGTYKSLKQILAPGMFWESLLLKQIVAYRLSQKEYFLVHGAAASKDGRAVILFGRGGTYKTTLLMTLLRQSNGWRIMGDDTVIVGDGQVFSFPALAGIFAFRYKYLPTETLSTFDRFRLLLFLMRFKSKDLPTINQSCLTSIIQCKVSSDHKISLNELEIGNNLSQLVAVSAAEDHSNYNIGHIGVYPRYVEAYTYVFPDNSLSKRWKDAQAQLNQVKNVRSFVLNLPNLAKPYHFSNAVEVLNNKFERQ